MEGSREVTKGSRHGDQSDSLGVTTPIDGPPSVSPSIPERVGRYRITACIGRGGMGVVLRAHDPQLDRVVAIKLLQAWSGPDHIEDTTKRLLREAQALAKLSHPNVIDVYDFGTADGRVFIAMEHVAGDDLRDWLRAESRSPAEVLEAFVQAGRGLAAAHEAGLVHRDFKPANVLCGDDGRVRVVDFGLATPPRDEHGRSNSVATLGSVDGDPLDLRVTATGFVVGTPAYMPPEAHAGGAIDARSDQFSFCVSLFEGLCGVRPFPGPRLEDIARQTKAGDVHFPADASLPAPLRAAILRGLSPRPEDRWPSMDALLAAIARRRRPWWRMLVGAAVATAGIVGLTLALVPGSASSVQCEQAGDAVVEDWGPTVRQRVREAFEGTAVSYGPQTWDRVAPSLDGHAQALAQARRQWCEAGLTEATTPEQRRAHERRAACLGRRQAELRGVVTVLERADSDTVRNAVRMVGDLRPVTLCDEDMGGRLPPPPASVEPAVDGVHDDLAQVRAMMRAGQYEPAAALAQAAYARAQHTEYRPVVAEARYLQARVLEDQGKYEEAEAAMSEATLEAEAAGHDTLVAEASTELIFLVGSQLHRPDEAEQWLRHARAAIERLDDATEGRTEAEIFLDGTLGNLRWSVGKPAQAREHFARALLAREQQLGSTHPTTLVLRSNLGMIEHELGNNTRARALTEQTLADRIEVFGDAHPEVAATYANLGVIEQVMGDLDAAAEHTRRALDVLEVSLGRDHPHYPRLLTNLANTEYLRGHPDDALRMHEQAEVLFSELLGPRAFLVGRSLVNQGVIHHELDQLEQARTAFVRGRSVLEEHLRPDHPELAQAIANLAIVDRDTGRLDEAIVGFDHALRVQEGALGTEHPDLADTLIGRGQTHLEAERIEPALADLRRGLALLEPAEVAPGRIAAAHLHLGQALWVDGQRAEAVQHVEQAQALMAKRPDADAHAPGGEASDAASSEARGGRDDALRAEIETWLAEHRGDRKGDAQRRR